MVLRVYRATQTFPKEEKFGLVSQMRRAAVSVPANIAEGFKRRGIGDKVHFYNIAEASLEELKYYFVLTADLGYMTADSQLMTQAETVSRLLHGLISAAERRRK